MVVARSSALSLAAALAVAVITGALVGVAGPGIAIALCAAPVVGYSMFWLAAQAIANSSALIMPTIAGSLTISQLPVLFGMNPAVRLVIALLLTFVAVVALSQPAHARAVTARALAAGAFFALLVVTLGRGALSGYQGTVASNAITIVQYGALFGIAIGAARSATNEAELARVAVAIAISPAVLVTVNLLLLLASSVAPIPMPEQISVALGAESSTLQAIGISAQRVQLPLSQSINAVGVVAAGGFAAGLVLAFRGSWRLGSAAAFVCLVGVMLADTRTALASAVVAVLVVLWMPRARWPLGLALLLPASPFVVMWLVERTNSVIGPTLSAGGRDFATASSRFDIWSRAIDTASHPVAADWLDKAMLVAAGYGGGGQIASGAAYRYAYLFEYQEYRLAHAHNVAIQTFLDSGLIGIACLVGAAYFGATGIARLTAAQPATAATLALFLVLFLGGLTESAPTYISPEALALVFMTLAVAVYAPRRRDSVRQ